MPVPLDPASSEPGAGQMFDVVHWSMPCVLRSLCPPAPLAALEAIEGPALEDAAAEPPDSLRVAGSLAAPAAALDRR